MPLVVNKVMKGVAAGVGLASESITAYNNQRRAKKTQDPEGDDGRSQSPQTPPEDTTVPENNLELQLVAEWELDEAQDELTTGTIVAHRNNASQETPPGDWNQLAELFLERYHDPPAYCATDRPKLEYPVIVPQRRPQTRKRGFIRAYAPALEEFGINQDMFIDFLETANRSCQGNPWLNAINLASIPAMFIPSAVSFAVSIMISVTTEMAIRADGRRKSNAFIDKINQELFRPRGLYCLVMTWKPDSDAAVSSFNMNTAISTSMDQGGAGFFNKMKHTFKSSNGKPYGDGAFPESAPLIFPGLDELAQQGSQGADKLKQTESGKRAFVGDYFDRRSQAAFTMKNPDSALNKGPAPQFTSRYADPSHPASSGSLVGLVTGGYITGQDIVQRREATRPRYHSGGRRPRVGPVGRLVSAVASRGGERGENLSNLQASEDGQYEDRYERDSASPMGRRNIPEKQAESSENSRSRRLQRPPGGGLIATGARQLLQSDVLYLMIVNMPSDEEIEEARQALQV
ncbi:hypothetical protein FE257_005652 [Aspergillus nanangensis]|uniref:Uncharacterized protein n=1 Tax=Aspergillus nanangensis TaxID=2582783 RepID=A0AAD4CB75_ASPNN|nr:hypothetical protein FE257_005652 [Aspergillus nanangensis]